MQFHRKGSSTISEYLHIFKNICDDLSAIGKPLTDRNKVFALLNGLGPDYESFVTTYLCPPIPTYKEIVPLLQGHETMRSIHTTESYGGTNQHMAFYGQRSPGQGNNKNFNKKGSQGHFNSKGRGFTQFGQQPNHGNNSQNFQGDNSFPKQNHNVLANKNERSNQQRQEKQKGAICQISNKPNHTALRCWNRFNQTYQPEDTSQALAAMTLADHQDNAWFPDTSAHMTADIGKLQTFKRYFGPEKIMVGNGDILDITHIGKSVLSLGNNNLELENVLVVPNIKKNLFDC